MEKIESSLEHLMCSVCVTDSLSLSSTHPTYILYSVCKIVNNVICLAVRLFVPNTCVSVCMCKRELNCDYQNQSSGKITAELFWLTKPIEKL